MEPLSSQVLRREIGVFGGESETPIFAMKMKANRSSISGFHSLHNENIILFESSFI
jgi:hypothetical protein